MNYERILGNGGVAFFTVLAATSNLGLTEPQAMQASILGAFIQAGLAACLEIQKESGGVIAKTKLNSKVLLL